MVIAFQAPIVMALALGGPCDLVTRGDVQHILHWSVESARETPFRLPQSSGSLCRIDAHEGTVLVTLPDRGDSFLQNNDLVDPFKNGLGTNVAHIADSVRLFDNTAYVSKHGRSVSVAVLPNEGTASESTLTAFARLVARKMP